MNIYQKAIKVRKTCENTKWCQDCKYFVKCDESLILQIDPKCENIYRVAKAIQEEKWNVK